MKQMAFLKEVFNCWLRGQDPVYEIFLKGKKVLDLGCGEGKLLEKDPDNFYGVDLNDGIIKKCQAKGLQVKFGNVTEIPYDDDSFDVIHNRNIIEHLFPEQAHKMLLEMKRVLKHNGLIILITPMPATIWNTFGHIKPYPPMAISKILREVSLESFDSVLGLKIKNTFYFGRWGLNKITFLISSIIANIFTKSAGLYLMTIEKTKTGR